MTYSLLLYIDPGSGSLLIQLLIAGLLGFLAYFTKAFAWLKNKARSLFNKNKGDNNAR